MEAILSRPQCANTVYNSLGPRYEIALRWMPMHSNAKEYLFNLGSSLTTVFIACYTP